MCRKVLSHMRVFCYSSSHVSSRDALLQKQPGAYLYIIILGVSSFIGVAGLILADLQRLDGLPWLSSFAFACPLQHEQPDSPLPGLCQKRRHFP